MGLLQNLLNFRFRTSTNNLENIWRTFGSFHANRLAMQGNQLIENSYERNIDVYSVIKKIVDVTKAVDWIVEEKQRDGSWQELTDTTIHELMFAPNVTKGYSWNDIEEQLLIYLLTCGNSFMYGQRGLTGNTILELDILPAKKVDIIANNNFFMPEISYRFSIFGKSQIIEKENISHLKFFNPAYISHEESQWGLSPIQVAAMVVQSGNDKWEADAALLQNRGAIGMITDRSQRPMLPDEAKKVQDDWERQTAGTHNFGKIKVTNKDLAFIQMAMSSTDLQLIEKGVVNLRAICNVFGIDSSIFNDPENKTFNNRREAEKAMYTNVIMPLSNRISESLTMFIARNHFPNREVRMRQDFSQIEVLQENLKEKSDIVLAMKREGVISAATAAALLDQPELNEPSPILSALSSVSPLIGNQMLQSLTLTELRQLIGLPPASEPTIGEARQGGNITVNENQI